MKAAYQGKARKALSIVIIGTIIGMLFIGWLNPVTAQEAPSAPTSFYGSSNYDWPGTSHILLIWTFNISKVSWYETQYRLYRGDTASNLTLIATIDISPPPSTMGEYQSTSGNYEDRNVSIRHIYYYQVSAANNAGESPKSEILEISHPSNLEATVPSPPQNVVASGGNGQITVTWDAPDDGGSVVTELILYQRTVPALTPNSGLNTKSISLGRASTSYVDMDVENQQIYYYQICAINAMGYGNASVEVSTMASDAYTVPTAPRNLQVTTEENQIVLAWDAPAENGGSTILYYNVYRGIAEGQEVFYQKVRNTQSFTDTNVVVGQDYSYTVSAVNGVGEGPQSKVTENGETPGFTFGAVIATTLLAVLIVRTVRRRKV